MTPAGGEIDIVDGGEFASISITHSITIAADGAGPATIQRLGPAIVINAGSSDAVVLRGLRLDGVHGGTYGVVVLSGSAVVDHCTIQNYSGGSGDAGIEFEASGASLTVLDSTFVSDGFSDSASIRILPASGAAATTVHLERVKIVRAIGNGVRIDGTLSPSTIDAELHEVTVAGSTGSAIVAVAPTSGGPSVRIFADNVVTIHNAGYGFTRSAARRASCSAIR